ncbi:hypothetical protein [Streptomyces sp. NPDC059224]|uniref:hypothetical protein n=1 Tax=Streptomyces sp. NPDC059224 TaxID=3346775 RepID=UPI003675AC15
MSDVQRKKSLMAAHSVALHVQVVSPVPPTTVTVTCYSFSPRKSHVDVSFHMDLDGVEQLAKVLGVETTTRPHSETDPQMYTVANAVVAGIPVKIWTLLDAPKEDGEPDEWCTGCNTDHAPNECGYRPESGGAA